MTTQLSASIGFVGAGNMAAALVTGMIDAGVVKPHQVALFDVAAEVSGALAERTGARGVTDLAAVASCDIVVLAVKPQVIPAVLADLSPVLPAQPPLVVSIAAGTPLARLTADLPAGMAVVRAMPNVNAMVGAGMTALCGNAAATAQQLAAAQQIFAAVGETVVLAERDFGVFTAIAGSAPAFVFEFIDTLAAAAVAHGLPKSVALSIATQTVLGSARTVAAGAAQQQTPADLADLVSSPAGTTIAGRLAMARAGFAPAIVAGVDAVVARDRELSGS